uniref:Uracil-DNA glycosylase-like domain-containing protein n=1 Tax=Paulinella longichromatophora TaxID=1708747 RepID=A0A2H4ZQ54_9EUKA|nr:hypothetical protein PLO_698 [Paulinella longichromatophora]
MVSIRSEDNNPSPIRISKRKKSSTKPLSYRINDPKYEYSISSIKSHNSITYGNPQANLMIIGQSSKANGVMNLPFLYRDGQLIDQMLASVGLDSKHDTYIYNVMEIQLSHKKRVDFNSVKRCSSYLHHQIERVQPKIILLAGTKAVENVLHIKTSISKIRGYWYRWGNYWLMPIFHPAYLRRNPSKRRNSPKWLTWNDLKDVQSRLKRSILDKSVLT